MSTKQLNDLNDLVSELKNTKTLTGITMAPSAADIPTVPEGITENNVDDFIFRKSSMLIQQGIDTIEGMKKTVLSGSDPETIEAYSKLMTAVASSIEILNKVNIQKRKERAAKELKQMDIDTSRKLLDKYDGPTIQNQTNILVASREEIMKALVGKAQDLVQLPDATTAIDS